MSEKKQPRLESPDVRSLQPVIIDKNTTIYVSMELDPEIAKRRYLERLMRKKP